MPAGYRPYKITNMNYDTYWRFRHTHTSAGLKKRDGIISGLIEPESSVLDLGCGDGRLLEFLQQTKKSRVLGIDISDEALKVAKNRGVPVVKADITSASFVISQEYDYIILSEVLEHFSFPEIVMREVSGKYNKSLLITVPNIGHLRYRMRLLFGRFPECWKWHPGEHVRFWTKRDLVIWLERSDNGFPSMMCARFYPCEGSPGMAFWKSLLAYNFVVEVPR